MAYTDVIRKLSIKELLRFLTMEGVTGKLTVYKENAQGCVIFRDGRILYANHSDQHHDTLAHRLTTRGINPEVLSAAEQRQQLDPEHRPLGDILIEMKALNQETLRRVMADRTIDIVRQMLAWSDGFYNFDILNDNGPLDVDDPDLLIPHGVKIKLPGRAA